MWHRAALIFIVTLLGSACGNESTSRDRRPAASNEPGIAITNVTVIDVVSGQRAAATTVLTKADWIVGIGAGIVVPAGTAQVDGTGKFLIPGLWDMHVHHQGTGSESLDLFVANGVIGTRDMGADADFILPLRDRINRGEILGPVIVAAGPILDDRPHDWPFRRNTANAEEARTVVRDLKKRGVDFIKVHDGTPRDVFFAIAQEASTLGLSFAGHVPMAVSIEEAVDAGIRSIEHLTNFRLFTECSTDGRYSADGCRSRFDTLAAKGVWQTPTIAAFHAMPDAFSGKPLPHGEYASATLLELTRANQNASKLDAAALASFRSLARSSLEAIGDLVARGNRLLAGCDGLVPGFCLHDELRLMVEAGLTPLQALQTATINPATFLERQTTAGTIAVGKRADLVLLDADPLIDIGNARRIAGVVAGGRLFAKADLDRIVAAHRRH